MDSSDLKTLDLVAEDVTPRSWEELVKDLLESDEYPDVDDGPVASGAGGSSSCSCVSTFGMVDTGD